MKSSDFLSIVGLVPKIELLCLSWSTCHLPHIDYGKTETGEQRDFTRIQISSPTHSLSGNILGGEPTVISAEHLFLMCYPSKEHKPRLNTEVALLNCPGALTSCFTGQWALQWQCWIWFISPSPGLAKGWVLSSPGHYHSLRDNKETEDLACAKKV